MSMDKWTYPLYIHKMHSSACPNAQVKMAVLDAPVEERIGGWNVTKKWYTEVEYVAVK